MKILFSTNNKHKLNEIKDALGNRFQVISLEEMGIIEDIPETSDTLKGNAIQKALYIFEKYKIPCFADDTGLEVETLDNRPGVYSARYAGIGCSFTDNVNKLLKEMQGKLNRNAAFRTVIALIESSGEIKTFEGEIKGTICLLPSGDMGFGYDPVFIPEGYNETFAEMPLSEKNKISHRARAVEKLSKYLHEKNQ